MPRGLPPAPEPDTEPASNIEANDLDKSFRTMFSTEKLSPVFIIKVLEMSTNAPPVFCESVTDSSVGSLCETAVPSVTKAEVEPGLIFGIETLPFNPVSIVGFADRTVEKGLSDSINDEYLKSSKTIALEFDVVRPLS